MKVADTPSLEENSVLLTRLPVFDDKRRLWGYELYCVGVGIGVGTVIGSLYPASSGSSPVTGGNHTIGYSCPESTFARGLFVLS